MLVRYFGGIAVHLGFDIDGVIANFSLPLIERIRRDYGVVVKESDIYCYDLNVVFGITKAEETKLVEDILIDNLPLYDGAKETLEQLNKEGHSIYLLTGRWGHLREATEMWLKENGVHYTELHLLDVGKKYQANVAPLDVIVEDSLGEAIEWSGKVKNILIYDHPWNKTLNVRGLTKRVYCWSDIYHEIQQLQASRNR
ncbi:MAG: hypothetical protein LBI79_05665 [Nitrososphaerota archaeon]|jgi:uncharacterized HAD superfamily protein|nr:hypothetical protein [Nitrososphaerota archaeon]